MSRRPWPFVLALALAGCDAADPPEDVPIGDPDYPRDPELDVELESARTGESHRAGENCMTCHQAHGPGPGRFTVAGTVYGPDGEIRPGGAIELWTESAAAGELALSVEVDAAGNFYTTAAIDLAEAPRFPYVRAADGATATLMPFPTRSGACNLCHAGGSSKPIVLP